MSRQQFVRSLDRHPGSRFSWSYPVQAPDKPIIEIFRALDMMMMGCPVPPVLRPPKGAEQ